MRHKMIKRNKQLNNHKNPKPITMNYKNNQNLITSSKKSILKNKPAN